MEQENRKWDEQVFKILPNINVKNLNWRLIHKFGGRKLNFKAVGFMLIVFYALAIYFVIFDYFKFSVCDDCMH